MISVENRKISPPRIYTQCTNVTDGQTDTGPQQRPRLRIASRGRNGGQQRKCVVPITEGYENPKETCSPAMFALANILSNSVRVGHKGAEVSFPFSKILVFIIIAFIA